MLWGDSNRRRKKLDTLGLQCLHGLLYVIDLKAQMLPSAVVGLVIWGYWRSYWTNVLKGLNQSIVLRELEEGGQYLASRETNTSGEFRIIDFGFEGNLQAQDAVIERLGLLHIR